ncbi:MAG: hypothetical protein GY856_05675, partial [bacterium]|nr:hypothetical protein [bacterium]
MNRRGNESWLDLDTRSEVSAAAASHRRVPALTLLHHPDGSRVGGRAVLTELGKDGGEIDLSRIAPAFAVPGEEVRWPLAVPWISRRPIRLIAADGAV